MSWSSLPEYLRVDLSPSRFIEEEDGCLSHRGSISVTKLRRLFSLPQELPKCGKPRCIIDHEEFPPPGPGRRAALVGPAGKPKGKLSAAQVNQIRLWNDSVASRAREMGIPQGAVYGIRRGETYRHVPFPPGWAPLIRMSAEERQEQRLKHFSIEGIRDIRSRRTSLRNYAKEYGVSRTTISKIQHRKSFGDVE